MSAKVGIVWNPSKLDEDELREALEEALDEVFGSEDESDEPEEAYDELLDDEEEEEEDDDDAAHGFAESSDDDGSRPELLLFETSEDDPGQGATSDALAHGCEVVIAAGGDGTVRAVAERLGRSGQGAAELGILPAGTGNLLARNLGIPLGDPVEALVRVFADEGVPLDLAEARVTRPDGVEERHGFVVMAGFGIDARMIDETDSDLKSKAGWLAYVESLGRAVSGSEVLDLTLSRDGGDPEPSRAHTVIVGSCGTLTGGVKLLPDAEYDDGELDVLVLSAENLSGWLETLGGIAQNASPFRSLFSGRSSENSEGSATDRFRVRTLRIELPEPQPFEIDGDVVGEVTDAEIRVIPSALRVRV